MTDSLRFLISRSIINSLKNLKKKPLKAIGIILGSIYFIMIPFISKGAVEGLGLNNKTGFIIIATIATIYIKMPSTLSYFKRKGVTFKKQDINFILATPTSPKQALVYALSKQGYLSAVMKLMIFIAAIFIFKIPVVTAIIYMAVSIIFDNLTSYSLGLIMYASEQITLRQKKIIRWVVYGILIAFTLIILYQVFSTTLKTGFDVAFLIETFSNPLVLLIPIFGWQLGWLNLIILGVTPINLVATILYIGTGIMLALYAYKMPCTGEYYEDALSFSENLAVLESKKGDISMAEAFGKKAKYTAYKGELKGLYSRVIFSKQLIERRRVRRFFFSLGDLLYLVGGLGVGLSYYFIDDFIDPDYFFQIMCGVGLYLSVFFNPQPLWKKEFSNYYIFVMPDSFKNKLLGATLSEHLMSLIRAVLLTLPAGILLRARIQDIFYAIIVQTLLKAMVTYLSIFVEEVIGSKIGKTLASFVNIFTSLIAIIIPIIGLVLSTFIGNFFAFLIISIYSLVVMFVFLHVTAKSLSNMENFES